MSDLTLPPTQIQPDASDLSNISKPQTTSDINKYLGWCLMVVAHYSITSVFPILHRMCLIGGTANIMVHLNYIKIQDPCDISIQFQNLCKVFEFGINGYMITLGVVPYKVYSFCNPDGSFESFVRIIFKIIHKIILIIKMTTKYKMQ